MRRFIRLLAMLLLLGGLPVAQDEVRVEFRVLSVDARGLARVDKGSFDGLATDDPVLFLPRGGGSHRGIVREVEARASVVQVLDEDYVPRPGARGVATVPAARLGEPVEQERPTPVPVVPEPPREDPGQRARYENQDEGWTSDKPLLGATRAVRSEERRRRWHGRYYFTGHTTFTSESDRTDYYFRAGFDSRMQNPFGSGGELRSDLEYRWRDLTLPDGDEDESRVRVERLSYRLGGTRFEPVGWEAGRFLQRGVPEFGVLDGFEWVERLTSGDRYGASAGFLPEPDADFETGQDFAVSGFYTWVQDPRELLTATVALQRSWHNGDPDRDLLFSRVHWAAGDGWDVDSSTWIDYYGGSDDLKSGLEITQALLSARKAVEGDGVDFRYRRTRFPEIDRTEFTPPAANEVADGHYDRLSASGWITTEADWLYSGELGVWIDEDENGGDFDLGIEKPWGASRRAGLAAFGQLGEFSSQVGLRLTYGSTSTEARWNVLYELANHHLDGFSDGFDDLQQHRLSALRDVRLGSHWTLVLNADLFVYDEDGGVTIGGYLQRSF